MENKLQIPFVASSTQGFGARALNSQHKRQYTFNLTNLDANMTNATFAIKDNSRSSLSSKSGMAPVHKITDRMIVEADINVFSSKSKENLSNDETRMY